MADAIPLAVATDHRLEHQVPDAGHPFIDGRQPEMGSDPLPRTWITRMTGDQGHVVGRAAHATRALHSFWYDPFDEYDLGSPGPDGAAHRCEGRGGARWVAAASRRQGRARPSRVPPPGHRAPDPPPAGRPGGRGPRLRGGRRPRRRGLGWWRGDGRGVGLRQDRVLPPPPGALPGDARRREVAPQGPRRVLHHRLRRRDGARGGGPAGTLGAGAGALLGPPVPVVEGRRAGGRHGHGLLLPGRRRPPAARCGPRRGPLPRGPQRDGRGRRGPPGGPAQRAGPAP